MILPRDFVRRVQASPLWVVLTALTLAVGATLLVLPFAVARYPAMIDLPFHAAQSATIAHYADPRFHFKEQFELRLFTVPYLTMYAIAAAAMQALPAILSVKIAAVVMLGLLPCGLAVLFRGMKKSPLLGVLGLIFAFGPLAQWGFLNFLGAVGLYALSLGLTLLLLERPTRPRQLGLALSLVVLFFCHVVRFPIAIVSVVMTAILVARPLRRAVAVILPALVPAALFGVWLLLRPSSFRAKTVLVFDTSRLAEIPGWLTGSFYDACETPALVFALVAVMVLFAFNLAAPQPRLRRLRWSSFRLRVQLVPIGAALGSLWMFLALPMWIGDWWYVYPREITVALFFCLALVPNLPRPPALRVIATLLAILAPVPVALIVARNYLVFDAGTLDFYEITRQLPMAPRLLYLVYVHTGSNRTISPYTHLPAWVQAERGGWISFHFNKFGASPVPYWPRAGHEAVVPPPTPPLWEATPDKFDVRTMGQFYEWFLVRKMWSPAAQFAADPSIDLVSHVGTWWLFHRNGPAPVITRQPASRLDAGL